MDNIVMHAVQQLDPPTQAELARVCGQKPQAVTRWVKTGKVPAHHCIVIEQATAGSITRHALRPDVFGPAPAPAQGEAA